MRFTWYLDVNISGRPLLVRISTVEKTLNENMTDEPGNLIVKKGNLKISSVIAFWVLFGLANALLLWAFFGTGFAWSAHLALYGMLSLLSLALFAVWKFLLPEDFLFQTASRIKNFLLTPLYSGLVFIFVKYFDSFVGNRER